MPKVIIIGGGVAGKSAAHELIERGFEVEVYERQAFYPGGKARSLYFNRNSEIEDFKYTKNIEKDLPGEHGFRFFPGFYKHITDTMKRIPYANSKGIRNTNGVFDNLVPVDRVEIARFGQKPIQTIVNFPKSFADLRAAFAPLHADTGLSEEEKHFFVKKVWQLMTSSTERRQQEYERIGWWEFMEADRFSESYKHLLVEGLTRTLVAANARYASTKTGGDIFIQLIFNIANPSIHADRVLNGPTYERWLLPWLNFLKSKGVKYEFNQECKRLIYKDGKITGAEIFDPAAASSRVVTGDYYLLAVPVERAAKLITNEMVAADAQLEGVKELASSLAWMNGIQFYLSEMVDIVHGHCIYVDSPWALTSISQTQFWSDYSLEGRANGKVKCILSIDISNWDVPGILLWKDDKPDANGQYQSRYLKAKDCTYRQIKEEVWAQLKKSLNVAGTEVLRDDMIQEWFLDHDIESNLLPKDTLLLPLDKEHNTEPLLVNRVNTWMLRPESYTRIPNMFLAGDYVRTYTDLATMEGANEAARRAVNNILEASGVKAEPCGIWNLHEPGIFRPFKRHDRIRFEKGLPYEFWEPWWAKTIEAIIRLLLKIFGKY